MVGQSLVRPGISH